MPGPKLVSCACEPDIDENCEMPIGRVFISSLKVTSNGHKYKFQFAVKSRTIDAITADLAIGNAIRKNICIWLAPSMMAASSISFGIPLKNCLKI